MTDWEQLQRLADRLRPVARRRFLLAMQDARRRASLARIEEALTAGRVQDAERLLTGVVRPEDLAGVSAVLRGLFDRAGVLTVRQLRRAVPAAPAFDSASARAIAWAEQHVGALLVDVTEDQVLGVRRLVVETLQGTRDVPALARLLRNTIGLTSDQRRAVANFEAARLAEGQTSGQASARAAEYAERKLRERAETIARTETLRSVHEGQREAWLQARDAGYILKMERRWIVTPDDVLCPVCKRLRGARASLAGLFQDPLTGEVVGAPPRHPRCRCAQALVAVRTAKARAA